MFAWQLVKYIYIGRQEKGGRWGGVVSRLHSLVDDFTNASEKISETEMDLHCKNCLSTVQLKLKF